MKLEEQKQLYHGGKEPKGGDVSTRTTVEHTTALALVNFARIKWSSPHESVGKSTHRNRHMESQRAIAQT